MPTAHIREEERRKHSDLGFSLRHDRVVDFFAAYVTPSFRRRTHVSFFVLFFLGIGAGGGGMIVVERRRDWCVPVVVRGGWWVVVVRGLGGAEERRAKNAKNKERRFGSKKEWIR